MTTSAVDLRGMPQPDNRDVTARLVADLLEDLNAGRDAEVVQGVAAIRELAGSAYTTELAARVGAVYRAREMDEGARVLVAHGRWIDGGERRS